MENKTIAVISTPIGSGAISIIRMSGSESLNIALKVFSSKKLKNEEITPRYLYLGDFKFNDVKEKCMMVYFKAPFSYTGEDLVEFQCHGGEYLTKKILEALLSQGATLAENGEFTKRAFLNGKMSLDEVEGVIDIINANSDAEMKTAYSLMKGRLYKEIKSYQDTLTELLADLAVTIDYPEHDDEEITLEKVEENLVTIKSGIENLLKTEKQGSLIKYGIKVALVGKTNVGKSSLLNALLGTNRAIVTDIEGTTRDIISETICYKDIKLNFIDTAGIRESSDKVEQIGIQKSRETIDEADIVLFLIDSSRDLDNDELELLKYIETKNHIIVLNKTDISSKKEFNFKNSINVSALKHKGIDELKEKIYTLLIDKNIQSNEIILTNIRQVEALKESLNQLNITFDSLKTGLVDIVSLNITILWQTLGKITGETENEEIIDKIFAKFCLGK